MLQQAEVLPSGHAVPLPIAPKRDGVCISEEFEPGSALGGPLKTAQITLI